MSSYILDKKCLSDDPLSSALAVRYVARERGYHLINVPEQDNLIVAGVTVCGVARGGLETYIRKAGIARCLASGQIELGDPVLVLAGGAVCSIYEWSNRGNRGPFNCLGFAERMAGEDVVEVFLSMHQRVE